MRSQASLLVASTLAIAGLPAANAQSLEPAHNPPVTVNAGFGQAPRFMGLTWDSHALVYSVAGAISGQPPVAQVCAARPEAVTISGGVPVLGGTSTTPPMFSSPVPFTYLGGPLSGKDAMTAATSGSDFSITIAPVAQSLLPSGCVQNPFPSDANGNFTLGSTSYSCYLINVYFATGDGRTTLPYLQRCQARVIIHNPGTPSATVVQASVVWPSAPAFLTIGSGTSQINIKNPGVTVDGRLIIGELWLGPGTSSGVAYSYNADPTAVGGWSTPQPITNLYNDRDVVLQGPEPGAQALTIGQRYALARQPLCLADGTPFTSSPGWSGTFSAVYPWVSFDGSEMVVDTTTTPFAAQPFTNAVLAGISMIGQATNWQLRNLDGPINPDRLTSERVANTSFGMTQSFWQPFRGVANGVLPYTGNLPGTTHPTYVFLDGIGATAHYNEIDMQDVFDQDYVGVYHMNEVIGLLSGACQIDATRTPDTSGNANTGALENGAEFAYEYQNSLAPAFPAKLPQSAGPDNYNGKVGSCIYFPSGGYIDVKSSQSLQNLGSVSVQLFCNLMSNVAMNLAQAPGAWTLSLDANGNVVVTVMRNNGTSLTLSTANAPGAIAIKKSSGWVNVAFSYDATQGSLCVYENGNQVTQLQADAIPLQGSTSDLLIGPGSPSSPPSTGNAIAQLDEVFISRVVRSSIEIQRNAFVNSPAPAIVPTASLPPAFQPASSGGTLPAGLNPADVRLPVSSLTAATSNAAVLLGQTLFFDPRLSRNGMSSCATCHLPANDLTDGRQVAQSLGLNANVPGAQPATRNTPATFNRALSSLQFWDGRGCTLEAQAAMPVGNPSELGLSVAELTYRLNQSNAPVVGAGTPYTTLFTNAFGSPTISRTTITQAIAAFERTLLLGGSAADTGTMGTQAQSGLALFNGKARCITCHSSSNFSDEQFHYTGNTLDVIPGTSSTDPGRNAITGRTADLAAFKTPSLRLLQLTSPYLHDGSVGAAQAQATDPAGMTGISFLIEQYNNGGISPTLPYPADRNVRPLELSPDEQLDLIAFLAALQVTDTNVAAPAGQAPPTGTPSVTALTNPSFANGLAGWDSGDNGGASMQGSAALLQPQSVKGALQPCFIEQSVYLPAGTSSSVSASVSNPDAPSQLNSNGQTLPTVLLIVRDASGTSHTLASQAITNAGPATLKGSLSAFAGQLVTIHVEAQGYRATVSNVSLAVNAAALVSVSAGNGQTAIAGSSLPGALVVTVTDASGLPVGPGLAVNFAVASGNGSIAPAQALTNASGQAQAQATLGTKAGTNTFTATVSGLAPVTFTETGTAGPAASIAIVSGNNQTGTAGSALAQQLLVQVSDANQNPCPGVSVTFAVSGGNGSIAPGSIATDANGQAQAQATLGKTAGANTFTATVSGIAVTFSETGTPGAAASLAIYSGNNQSGTAGSALAQPFVIYVMDANQNVVPGVSVTFAVTSGGGSLSQTHATTGARGGAGTTLTLGKTPGTNTVSATVTNLAAVHFTATGK